MTTIASLLKRVERIEAKQHVGAPTKILANYPVEDEEARDALTNQRRWVADGRASVKGDVLWLMQLPLTVEEWITTYSPRDGHLQQEDAPKQHPMPEHQYEVIKRSGGGLTVLIQHLEGHAVSLKTSLHQLGDTRLASFGRLLNGPILDREILRRRPLLGGTSLVFDVGDLDDVIHTATLAQTRVKSNR